MNILSSWKSNAIVIILMMLMALANLPLTASNERRGSRVVVTQTDGNLVRGELLAVKADALLIYDQDSDQAKSIDLQQVTQVRLLKKSKFLTGFVIGAAVGLGYLIFDLEILGNRGKRNTDFQEISYIIYPPFTGLVGGLLGTLTAMSANFSLVGESPERVQQNLERLKCYAREQEIQLPLAPH
jgi:hypothetical protein